MEPKWQGAWIGPGNQRRGRLHRNAEVHVRGLSVEAQILGKRISYVLRLLLAQGLNDLNELHVGVREQQSGEVLWRRRTRNPPGA